MTRISHGRDLFALALLGLGALAGCTASPIGGGAAGDAFDTVAQAVTVPAQGGDTTLDIASWNLEWFGDPSNGPTDDALQLQNVRDVIAGTDFDIWGIEEVVSNTQWDDLVSQLPGYTGLVANDSSVIDGPAYYNDFSGNEQKVAILYKSALATVQDARIVLTDYDYEFAGRPPMQVILRVSLNGLTEDVIVIVLHAKCCSDTTSWQRRQDAAIALKAYLDATFPTQKVWVIGDYNDDVDTSITAGHDSPYANLVLDTVDYTFPTKALSDAGIGTTVNYSDAIDHHLNTNESNALYIAGSVQAYRVDQYIADYGNTTSDHYPVLTRYQWGGGGGGTPAVTLTAPNGGESWGSGSQHNVTWTSSNVADVRLDYSVDDGASWNLITSSTVAITGSYTWTVPDADSALARVRVSDVGSTASDTSDGTFTITPASSGAHVIMNELLANEVGSDTGGEFVELVNVGNAAADISAWKIYDTVGLRHEFAAGSSLPAGQAVVVFASASAIPAGLDNAVAASTGALGLNNSGDTIRLDDANGITIDSVTYGSSLASQDGVSMNRNPDATADAPFVLHNTISTLPYSPGKRADGSDFASCMSDADCSDGDACNGVETCQAGACVAGTALVCDDGDPCTVDSCDPMSGCAHVAAADGASCSDGDACNGAETCQAGVCVAGTAPSCDDGNVCTDDSCDAALGCVHADNTAPCDDGNACTTGDVCGGGSCGGAPVVCDDGNLCTADSCDPATGCAYVPVTDGTSCSDGDVCNGAETCQAGACVSGTALSCDDGDACTTDTCDSATGCQHENTCTPQLIASEGFESGLTGGTGWSEASWRDSGDVRITSDGPHSGSYHARLRRGNSSLKRTVSLAGRSGSRLRLWARVRGFEGSDQAYVRVTPTPGASYTTALTLTPAESDDQYHFYDLDLSVCDGAASCEIAFESGMNAPNDIWYVDDIEVTAF